MYILYAKAKLTTITASSTTLQLDFLVVGIGVALDKIKLCFKFKLGGTMLVFYKN